MLLTFIILNFYYLKLNLNQRVVRLGLHLPLYYNLIVFLIYFKFSIHVDVEDYTSLT